MNSDTFFKFDNLLRDQTVFLIGSGESIRDYDLSWLKDRMTMIINSSIKLVNNPTFLAWSDIMWMRDNKHVLKLCPTSNLIQYSFNPQLLCDHDEYYPNVRHAINVKSLDGFCHEAPYVHGNNTGTRSLNFLSHFKPYNIVMVGFDLQGGNWHGRYPATDKKYHDQFLENFEQMAPYIKELGINVYNASKRSRLTCFEKTDIREWSDEGDATDWWKE